MEFKKIFYPESKFGGFSDIDGTIAFYNRVNSLLTPDATVLDVGCGTGAHKRDPVLLRRNLQVIRGKVSKVIGIDVDSAVETNPYIDEFRKIVAKEWPVASGTIDLIVCDNVLEHIENPYGFFFEARRALRDGGYICIRTPNAWSYVALLARMIPSRFHFRILRRIHTGRKDEDIHPTFYRCNSVWKIKAMMKEHGFEAVVYGYEAEPSYLSWSKTAYRLGVLHQRFAPNLMKISVFAFGKLRTRS